MTNLFPLPGVDPEMDLVRGLIGRVSLGDPAALRALLIAVLRFFREQGLPGVVVPFTAVLPIFSAADSNIEAISYAIDPEARSFVLLLLDGPDRAAILERMATLAPKAERTVIDPGPERPV